jgi:hypothetical protein
MKPWIRPAIYVLLAIGWGVQASQSSGDAWVAWGLAVVGVVAAIEAAIHVLRARNH